MIDLKTVSEIKNVLNNKLVEKIEDSLGNIIWEGWKKLIKQGIPPLTLTKCKENNLLNYQIYGNSKQGRLPKGYTELEYIESTGEQYIDTGVKVSTNNKIIADLQFTDVSRSQINGGYYIYKIDNTSYTVRNDIGVTSTGFFFMGASATSITTNVTADTNRHTFMVDATTGDWSIDNVSGNVPPISHEDTIANVLIGARQGTTITSYCYEKIYNVKIYNSGNLVRDLVPAKNSSGTVGMYDLVNNVFYTNQGTGAFTTGPEIPNPDSPIEIQSVGDKTKNWFDENNATFLNGWINDLGVFTSNSSYKTFNSYYDRVCEYSSNTEDTFVKVTKADNRAVPLEQRVSITFTTSDTTNYIRLNMASTDPEHYQDVNIQIEEGSTPTDYEPYGYKIPVNVKGKNILNPATFTNTGTLLNASGELGNNTNYKTTDYIWIKAGTYTLSLYNNYDSTVNTTNRMALYDSNKTFLSLPISTTSQRPVNCEYTFTIESDCYYRLSVRNTDENLMLEENSSATPYEEYFNRTDNIYLAEPLRKIGNADAVKLPSGYTQLEYIESTGTQYIDTGVILTQEHSVEIEAKLMARVSNKSYYLFGVSTSGKRYAITVGAATNTYNFDFIDSTYRINSEINAFDNAFHVHKIENLNYYIDGILQGGNSLTGNTYNSSYLFDTREHTIVSTTGEQRWKVKRCSIWNGSLLVRNFIPAKRNSNGEIGMYDLVNDTFYSNQGTGDFTAGPQIYADYVDFENQKVVRNVRELVITGDEAWEFINNIARFTIANSQLSDTGIDYSAQLCNYFKCDQITTGSTIKGASVYYSSSLGGTFFRVRDDALTSSTVAKQFFKDLYDSGKPCKIYYQSAVLTEESVELPDILLNKGTNIIDVETSVTPSNLWLKYKGKE